MFPTQYDVLELTLELEEVEALMGRALRDWRQYDRDRRFGLPISCLSL